MRTLSIRPGSIAIGIGFAIIALVIVLGANAQDEAQDEPPRENIVVMIASSSQGKALKPIIQAVRGQLSDLPVSFDVTWVNELGPDLPAQEELAGQVADDKDATAVFWCDLSRSDKMYVYIAAPEIGRVLVRRLDGSGPGGTPETLAIIVRASINSMLRIPVENTEVQDKQKEESDVEEQGPAEETPPAEIETPVDKENRLGVEAAYAIDMMHEEHLAVHGLALTFDVHIVKGLHVFLGYLISARIPVMKEPVRLELTRHPISIGARFAVPLGRIYLGGSVSANLDYTTESRETRESSTIKPKQTNEMGEFGVSIAPMLRMGLRIIDYLKIFLSFGVDIALTRQEFVVEVNNNPETVFYSWAVHPIGRIGVSVGFL
ncbi:MAG: hypothetical protein GY847_19480 [Proteobacteria bacterium]|nr:hypothetical protein [Pseudomonadota bacterium]